MKLKSITITAIAATLALASCDDDNTSTLGVDMMPVYDMPTSTYQTYPVKTESYAVGDAVLARTGRSYLGQFTDPETQSTVRSEFLTQFHCDEGYALPDQIDGDSCTQMELILYVDKYVGDPLAPFKLSVYELNSQLDPNADYYTDINPSDFCDTSAEPIATKWFTLSDRTIADEDRQDNQYLNHIRVSLPHTIGTQLIHDYREHPEHFTNTSTWIRSGNPCAKGLYFKIETGDGAMAYIGIVQLKMHFTYYDTELRRDMAGASTFSATDAVVAATRFDNTNLDRLLADRTATYLKSPAGIFTLATIPADQMQMSDTLNSVKLTLTRYNDLLDGDFKLDIPQTILLVRLDDYLNGFFENYRVNDSKVSFLTGFDQSTNTYVFDNIARLVAKMAREKQDGIASPNWNKVLIIPVETTKDSNGNIVKLNHDFTMSCAKLVGGDTTPIQMEVIYSRFH